MEKKIEFKKRGGKIPEPKITKIDLGGREVAKDDALKKTFFVEKIIGV